MKLRDQWDVLLRETGAVACGVCRADCVDDAAWSKYQGWLATGSAAGMGYLKNHGEIRRNPSLLLDGAQSIICIAFSFLPDEKRGDTDGHIAAYAYGEDYHDVLRERLGVVADRIHRESGYEYDVNDMGERPWRICIDSAPIMERYWALRARLGLRGDNGMVIIPGAGAQCFLAEIISRIPAEELTERGERWLPSASFDECLHCGRCRESCPGGALRADGTVDATRCLSYLTIEHKGEFDEEEQRVVKGKNILFGCDECITVCPYNEGAAATTVSEFRLRPEVRELTPSQLATMTPEDFSRLFRRSPLKRAKLAGLRRNTLR